MTDPMMHYVRGHHPRWTVTSKPKGEKVCFLRCPAGQRSICVSQLTHLESQIAN